MIDEVLGEAEAGPGPAVRAVEISPQVSVHLVVGGGALLARVVAPHAFHQAVLLPRF